MKSKTHANKHYKAKRARKHYRVIELKNELKSGGCVICGYSACLGALEFHHTNNDKERELSKIHTIALAEREAGKCIVVCANCHREIHAGMIDMSSYVVADTNIPEGLPLFCQGAFVA